MSPLQGSPRQPNEKVTPPSRWIVLSVGAALLTMAIKVVAAVVTNSVGFLSDAMESGVNLVAALTTMYALRWSEVPADKGHPFGHAKGELLAALLEGVLVSLAGLAICATAFERLANPATIARVPLGAALSFVAALVNGAVGVTLVRVGRKKRSPALEADGHHLLTDVWSSVAVIVGVTLALVTKITWLDPLSAVLVAVVVLRAGYQILRKTMRGLVDARLDAREEAAIENVLAAFRAPDVVFEPLRARQAGRATFVSLTVRVPGSWNVDAAHELADKLEVAIGEQVQFATVEVHIEPLEEKGTK